ncbi:MAG: DNA methyltransferase [Acetobacterales bacterium]
MRLPQVLCEFKDITSALDAPQRRKRDNRSPVQQGLSYLSAARRGIFGHEPIVPTFAIITDMNEFRLYWADKGERQSLRFVIKPGDLFQGPALISETEEARFDRFLFMRLFHRDMLTVQAASGRARLLALVEQQRFRQRELENTFYAEYRSFREHLYQTLLAHNGPGTDRFPGTRGRLVRLAQKILDRCIFIFYCEDVGRALRFRSQLLRDFLIHHSNDDYFDPEGGEIWARLIRLFNAMNDGSMFGDEKINQFNGGLFAADDVLESFHIPNSVFCERGQGQNETSLARNPRTLLYLSASYNYATGWSEGGAVGDGVPEDRQHTKSLGLYTLGRIFEQSITELEILEADADERPSLNRTNKRKRDGVYYTPEWIVERIVVEAVGARLDELKAECGWPTPGAAELPNADAIHAYDAALREVYIVDPACGSGAFLITALRYLIDEWSALRAMRRDLLGERFARDDDAVIRDILRRNLYGVDINPASVEIAKLALWLYTARGDKPLFTLDDHIREGNSLIGPEFYDNLAPYTDEERERVNAFDWQALFPKVFERGGFDVVVGNPPYVKLQNFRKVHADMAAFLRQAPNDGGRYESTQTGNFDLFLPFIEKGVSLLNERGRLGYIAPNLWPGNEYGDGLRRAIARGRNLYGWIDFGSHQIFDEAITYTALQFYSRAPNEAVCVASAPDGVIPADPWGAEHCVLPYERLPFGDRWLLTTGPERDLIDRLARTCLRLDNPRLTRSIYQGLITSADHVYHLRKLGPGRYECCPRGRDAPPPYEVRIEDEIMNPLVSGTEAKRYIEPRTDTYLLFPYDVEGGRAQLISSGDMADRFPQAWAYLQSWERELRARQNGHFDDDQWWRYGRHQNMDKQEIAKLLVPRLVVSVSCSADSRGSAYLDNVDVGGVAAAPGVPLLYLAGILNAPVADFVFRRISKPFQGDYRSANKQFIAPLPIPDASDEDRAAVAARAECLQQLHTRRRALLLEIGRRMGGVATRMQRDVWLFPDLPEAPQFEETAPVQLDRAERRAWARQQRDEALNLRHERLGERLRPGVSMDAVFEGGELRFLIDGETAVDRVFLDEADGPFVLAQWKLIASNFNVTESTTGKKLSDQLRKVALTTADAVREQIMARQRDLSAVEIDIATSEAEINALVYRLYELTPEEIALVEAG